MYLQSAQNVILIPRISSNPPLLKNNRSAHYTFDDWNAVELNLAYIYDKITALTTHTTYSNDIALYYTVDNSHWLRQTQFLRKVCDTNCRSRSTLHDITPVSLTIGI